MPPASTTPPNAHAPSRAGKRRIRPWASLVLALLAVTGLLAGCGLAGAASGLTASILVPWVVIVSLVAFLVGCGGSNLNGGGAPAPVRIAAESAAPVALKFITQPAKTAATKTEALTPITPAPQVAVVDGRGAIVSTAAFPITISLDENPGNAVLAGTTTVNAENGVATFSDLRISRAASGYTLKATADELRADTSVVFTVEPLSPVFVSAQARVDYSNGLPIDDRVNRGATDQVVGDFNGDGHDDVAVAASNYSVPSITVMLGDGTGRLGAPRSAYSGPAIQAVGGLVAVDADGDARDDLAFTYTALGSVNVLRSNGDGTFTPLVPITGLGTPVGLVSGDFDRDGKADLAAGLESNASGVAGVLLGNGNGTFRTATPFIIGLPNTLATGARATVGRFNGDAFDDLAITSDGNLITLLGNGNGTFAAGVSYTVTQGGPDALVHPSAARLGSDLLEDVLVNSGSQLLHALTGDGTGGFSATTSLGVSNASAAVATDLDGNGQAEIIVNRIDNTGASHRIAVLPDFGGMNFFAVSDQAANAFGAPPALGDFNEDGRTDAVTSVLGTTSVLLGLPQGVGFSEPFETDLVSQDVVASVVVDADGDGTVDLLTAGRDAVFGFQQGLAGGQFGPVVPSNTPPGASGLAAGDLNGDGRVDAVLSRSRMKGLDVTVLLNQGAGAFTASSSSTPGIGYNTAGVTLADVNRDGRLDIVANTDTTNGGVSELLVMLGNGNGTFGPAIELATANTPTEPRVADVNADGNPDIAVSCRGASVVQTLLGNGDGTFGAAVNVATLVTANGIIVGDLDGDGKTDLAAPSDRGAVAVLLGNGDATFRAPLTQQASIPLQTGVAVDFTADGRLDLVVASGDYSDVAVLTGNGDGTFAAALYVGTGDGKAVSVSVADINGDGKPDIVNANRGWVNSTVNLHQ